MASLNKLNNSQVKSAKGTGLLSDGGGLYLQISKAGTKSWLLRFNLNGKRREMGLGSYRDFGLADARDAAADARKLSKKGIDPIKERKDSQQAALKLAQGQKTFKECAEKYIADHEASWKNPKHIQQWKNSLINYAYPVFGDWPIGKVDHDAVQRVLNPIWHTKTETANRVRGRIERVLDWAKVKKMRSGENPALWRGNLEHIYPKPNKLINVVHMPSLPFTEMSSFLSLLRNKKTLAASAVELMIYTVTRPNEAVGAKWAEFDIENKTWAIPKERMKGNAEHIIPLSNACLTLLNNIPHIDNQELLFPNTKKGKPITDSAMLKLTKSLGKEIGCPDITDHGFRASFKTWASETQNFDRQAVEFCLAHKIKDKAEASYHRGNLLDKRLIIMNTWARYCLNENRENVIPIRAQLT